MSCGAGILPAILVLALAKCDVALGILPITKSEDPTTHLRYIAQGFATENPLRID